jgi:hypothetical protein
MKGRAIVGLGLLLIGLALSIVGLGYLLAPDGVSGGRENKNGAGRSNGCQRRRLSTL